LQTWPGSNTSEHKFVQFILRRTGRKNVNPTSAVELVIVVVRRSIVELFLSGKLKVIRHLVHLQSQPPNNAVGVYSKPADEEAAYPLTVIGVDHEPRCFVLGECFDELRIVKSKGDHEVLADVSHTLSLSTSLELSVGLVRPRVSHENVERV